MSDFFAIFGDTYLPLSYTLCTIYLCSMSDFPWHTYLPKYRTSFMNVPLHKFQLLKLVNHSQSSSLVGKTSQTIVVFKECELLIECLDSGQNSLSHTFINEPTKKHHWSLFDKKIGTYTKRGRRQVWKFGGMGEWYNVVGIKCPPDSYRLNVSVNIGGEGGRSPLCPLVPTALCKVNWPASWS